jgi:LCP family protein required for cell wall assembly
LIGFFIFKGTTGLISLGNPLSWRSLPKTDNRTNFLLLGFGGTGHSGGDLSDSIIFVSINDLTKVATLLTIPRDIWIDTVSGKINSAYKYGFEKSSTPGGILMAKSVVSDLLGERVHFVVGFDFSTLVNLVDSVGGITVSVEKTFDDYKYPIAGKENDVCGGDPALACRYEHIKFESGIQTMNGETALKFVRSRYSTDLEEGTDFARSKRQSNVLSALWQKTTSINTLTNLPLIKRLFRLGSESLISDIKSEYYYSIVKEIFAASKYRKKTYSLIDSGIFINPDDKSAFDNQWVLVIKNNDPSGIHSYVDKILSSVN